MTMDHNGMGSVGNVSGNPSSPPRDAQSVPPGSAERDPRARSRSHHQALGTPTLAGGVSSAFVPLLLAGLALLGWLGFQAQQLMVERQALQTAYASQQQTVDNSAKLRASLDILAADTQRLADSGNLNARALVDELKKRGVTINSANTPSAPASPAASAAR